MSFSPSPGQEDALKKIVQWYKDWKRDGKKQEFYLAGFAGTGKSTLAAEALADLGLERTPTCTYTGKAASVLRKKGIEQAQTIHSLIYKPKEDKETGALYFKKSYTEAITGADMVLLDECSMVDDDIARDLRSFGKPILIMGDPGQLPPIKGQGAFTNREPDAFLHEIHRQAAESPIIELATMARQGKALPKYYEKNGTMVLPLNKASAENIYNENTQVICGLNRVRWKSTQMIRTRLQGIREEPSGMDVLCEAPIVGERVICCKNNKELGIFNGQMGIIKSVRYGGKTTSARDLPMASFFTQGVVSDLWTMQIDMEDNDNELPMSVDPYLFAHHFTGGSTKASTKKRWPNEFDWAYVITCHKAQGSQWDHVTVIDDSGSFRENQEKWLYTALTRAANGLTVLSRD